MCGGELGKDKWNRKRKKFCSQPCFHKWVKTMPDGKEAWRKAQEVNIPLLKKRVGKLNPAYKGVNRKKLVVYGYTSIPTEDHPFGGVTRRVMEHRLVMEEHLRQKNPKHLALVLIDGKKYLSRDWVVHHKNGKRNDNRVENLELFYMAHHTGHSIICVNCGKDALTRVL